MKTYEVSEHVVRQIQSIVDYVNNHNGDEEEDFDRLSAEEQAEAETAFAAGEGSHIYLPIRVVNEWLDSLPDESAE